MIQSVALVVFLAFVLAINASTIITRGMIRTPMQSSQSKVPQIVLPDPEKLVFTNPDVHKKYQRIFPSFVEEERTDFKRVLEDGNREVLGNNSETESIQVTDNASANVNQDEPQNLNKSVANMEPNVGEVKENSKHTSGNTSNDGASNNGQLESSSTISPQEISKRYWEHYNNLSSDFFTNSYPQNLKAVSDEKGFSDGSFFEILQRFYTCMWAIGLMPCIQETLRFVSSETSFLQFLSPRLPRFQLEGSAAQEYFNNGETDQQVTDEDEGRKRTKRLQVFQTLQFILPLLLAIKMSMLPALAVMVLVAGKAFLMSLLSLGAAIFSFILQTPGLAANKRQEISPQMPANHNQDPSKYYYVM